MIEWIWLLCLVLVTPTIKASVDWCASDLCNGQHVLCQNNGKFRSPCPEYATAMVKMKGDMIALILDKHNDYRNKFAGGIGNHAKAARMATIQWDSELAKVADALVRRCEPIRDQCAKTPNNLFAEVSYSLEKYFCMTTKKDALRKQLDYWFDPTRKEESHKLFFSDQENEQELSMNYFQVVRDRANRVGCAIVEYIRPALVHQLLKCVYNCGVTLCEDNHNPVYEATEYDAAEECMLGSNSKYKNLCHEDEQVKTCEGGDLLVEDENESSIATTIIPLPSYNVSEHLPSIPDNPNPFEDLDKSDELPDNPEISFRTNRSHSLFAKHGKHLGYKHRLTKLIQSAPHNPYKVYKRIK
ncbi:venom allergen 5.01 [Drosophila biarmipes]|uniref:venom allergen 5.01 n=1 Tax=Drosophila biarmipes TaxID=125945 RepID=UPI0007E6DBE1|nr:venom allergen 5.01 [Drosophila biarmipes]